MAERADEAGILRYDVETQSETELELETEAETGDAGGDAIKISSIWTTSSAE